MRSISTDVLFAGCACADAKSGLSVSRRHHGFLDIIITTHP
jgi:hypothetical protein